MKFPIPFPSSDSDPRCRFSVITATYNRAHLITRTYESLRAQTFQDFEWIIIDDGSTDDTFDLVRSWLDHDQPHDRQPFPISYLRKENGGLHTALNLGTEFAEGEFVTQ